MALAARGGDWPVFFSAGSSVSVGAAAGVAVGGVASVASVASADRSEPSAGGVALASMKVEAAADEAK